MLPGPPLRKECPHCHRVKELLSLLSGNTIGAKQWSDTKTVCRMLPRNSDIQKCPSCGKYFFLSDAKTLPSTNESAKGFTMDTGHLSYQELREAFMQLYESATEDQKYVLHLNILYSYNDRYRKDGSAEVEFGEEYDFFVQNCQMLLKMNRVIPTLCAELYREIGEFEQCVQYLDSIEPVTGYENEVREQIRKRALDGDRMVFQLG